MNTLVEVQHVSKSFRNTQVLHDICLNVARGEFVAIMGQSGSGKSTLLYCLSGMDKPTSGHVLWGGEPISSLDDDTLSEFRLKRMGFVFQHAYLLKNLSIQDNILLPGFKSGKLSRDQVIERADALMRRTGISGVASHDIKQVSGGQLQRAAICRALINEPDLLFADEPTGALNSSQSREVMDIMNAIHAEGTTIILVTHDVKVAARADKVIFLMDGSIHDECILGRYDEQQELTRVNRLSAWLDKHRF